MEAEAQARSMRVPEGVDLSTLGPAEIASVLQKNMDATASLQYKFEAMILEWTLLYDDGQPAPYTPALLAQMPKGYADWIADEIEKRGGAPSKGEDVGPLAMTSAPKLDLPSGTASVTALDGSLKGRSTKPA